MRRISRILILRSDVCVFVCVYVCVSGVALEAWALEFGVGCSWFSEKFVLLLQVVACVRAA